MQTQASGNRPRRRSPTCKQQKQARAGAATEQLGRVFTPAVVDELRAEAGYNPRQRHATAHRLLAVVVEAFLFGQTLGFARIRAFFVRRFGSIRPRAFQLRFKQPAAVAFFRAAFNRLTKAVLESAGLRLGGPLAAFSDVLAYDATGQRVPPRGRPSLPSCVDGRAGAKCLVGYSLKTGLITEASHDAETASELPMWRKLVPALRRGVLYLMDLAFLERALFVDARAAGAHVLMRLKSNVKVTVIGHLAGRKHVPLPSWSLNYYLRSAPTRRGTLYDLDVRWGRGHHAVDLRLVGISLGGKRGLRFYLTTVPRDVMTAAQLVEGYRLRWLIEFLFREMKQSSDIGRSATADADALQALTYGAMIGHLLVRSLRVVAALRHDVPLEQLRPLACLHIVRPFADALVGALLRRKRIVWRGLVVTITAALVEFARELKPSKSRPRIALTLGARGG